MEFDVAKARSDTPGCQNLIYFNNAAASLSPEPVLRAVADHLRLEATVGGYEAEARHPAIRTKKALSTLIGANPEEIALSDNATRAWNDAFAAIPLKHGDRVLVSRAEFINSSLTLIKAKQETGIHVELIPCDETGQLSIDHLKAMMDERVRLIAVTHVPTNGGLVNPAREVGQVARAWSVLYLLDASQSVGQIPINVETIGCDLLSAPGRKYLRGPRGTGFLYAKTESLERLKIPTPTQDAGSWLDLETYQPYPDARRFEVGECYVAGRVGLRAAVEYALAWGIDPIWKRIQFLANSLRSKLQTLSEVTVQDLGEIQCGIVTFTHARFSTEEIKERLSLKAIEVKASPSRQARWDMEARDLPGVVRASLHYYNTEDELERFVEAISAY